MANDNPGYISKLHTTPDARLVDGTDNIHSGIINALNEATAGNRTVSGFNITQSNQDVDYTKYDVAAGKILRDGLLVDISGVVLTTSVGPRGGNDWYALIVVNSSNALAIRVDAQTKSTASVSTLTAGDIPVAIVKYLAGSANDLITRKVQFLGHSQTTQGLSLINSGAETVRLNAAGTITKGGATLTLPSSTGTIALTSDIHYTSAIPNATASQTGLATSTQITKLDGIEAGAKGDQTKAEIKTLFSWSTSPEDGATADQTDTQIETAYNNRVAQVSSEERTAGNSTAIKRFTPADIKSMIDTHQTDTNTDTDVTLANLKNRLASNMGDNFQIGSNSAHTATFAGGLIIGGNLTVNGTTTTISSNTLAVGDNIIVLNNDVTGTPSQNAGMEIERGSATNVGVRWNESSDRWEFTNDGTTYYNLPTTAELANPYTHPLSGTTDIDTSGAEIVDAIATNDTGHITAMSKRTLTLSDLGYTGATDANKYVHPNHSGDVTSSADGATTIANNAVTSAKIADSAITTAKINNGAINNDKISTSAAIAQSKISGLTTALSGKEPSLTIGDGLDRTSATLKVDIDGLTIESGLDRSADYIMYDDATNGLRKINATNLFSKLIAGDIPDLSATYRATGTTLVNADISSSAAISADKIADGSTNKVFTSTLKTKLDGIAASATVGADWSSNVSNISVTNAQLAGSIANTKLANSSITLNGSAINLGGSLTLDTDDLAEGSNKYYTDERVDDRVNALITDGEGITTTYDDSAGTLTVDAEIATSSNKGVASFSSDHFVLNSGNVAIKDSSITNQKLTGSIAQSKVTDLVSDLATKAPIANPTFTGSITIGSASLTEAELELIDGVVGTLSTTELGYLDGVTSSIQTQLNAKIESVALSDLTDNLSLVAAIDNSNTNSQIPTARAVKNYVFSQEIKSYDLVLAENGDNAKIRLEDNLGDLTNFVDINAGTDISLDVDPTQRDIRISNTGKGHVASASYNQGTLTLTHRDNTTTTATIPDSTTDAHGLMTDDQFDKLAAIEALADVTDKANVVAALGLLDEGDTLYVGDAGNDTTVRVRGNLFVDGTTTTINQTEINVQDALVFEGATGDDYETTLRIIDPTADRVISLPDITGTIVTTGDSQTVATGMIANLGVTTGKINSNAVTSGKLATDAVITAKIQDDAVTTAKIVDDAVTIAKIDGITDAGSGSVITSAERTKLSGIATGAEVNVQSDWSASSGDAKILNKPNVQYTSAIPNATASQTGLATSTQITKLDAIEASADVTDATNVNAAGAVMHTDIPDTDTGFIKRTGSETYDIDTSTYLTSLSVTGLSDIAAFETNFADGVSANDDSLASAKAIKTYVDTAQSAATGSTTFTIEDDDDDTLLISQGKHIKFDSGAGISTDWTDTDNGTNADPYTMTIANTGVTSNVAGTGISVSSGTGAVTVTNTDLGSSQNIFKNIKVSGQSDIVAETNDDDLTFAAGSNVTLTTNATNDTLTITSSYVNDDVSVANLKTRLNSDLGGDFTIGTQSDDTATFTGGLIIGGNLTVNGTTTTLDTTNLTVEDKNIVLASGNTGVGVLDGTGFTFEGGSSDDITLQTDTNVLELKLGSSYGSMKAGTFTGDLTGDVTGNADTATEATNVTATANNSTDETVYPVFVDGATGTQGIETDTGLTYNPSTGLLTVGGLTTGGTVQYGSLSDGAITITAFESTLTNGASLVPTSAAVKTYVDAQVDTVDSLGEMSNVTLTNVAQGHIITSDDSGAWSNRTLTAGTNVSITNASTGAITIASTDTTYTVASNKGLALSGTALSIDDPVNTGITLMSSGAAGGQTPSQRNADTADEILIWDADNNEWAFMTLAHLADYAVDNGGESDGIKTFRKILVDSDTNSQIEADITADTLNITSGSGITVASTAGTDTLTFSIASGAISNAMLADDAVGADELASNAVVNASIASGAAIDMDKLDGDSLATAITDFAQDDLVILSDTSDSGNLVKMTTSNFEDAIFGNVSGDIAIAAGGAATIQANSVALGTDTTGNYMTDVSAGTGIDIDHTAAEGSTATIAVDVSDFMANGADNYVLTATGADGINAESGLYFDGNLGINTNSPTARLHINNDETDASVDAPASFGIYVDHDSSGSQTTGNDDEQGGIYVSAQTTSTGGDSSDEHRLYGMWSDTRTAASSNDSDFDEMIGVYGLVKQQQQPSSGITHSKVSAVDGWAMSSTSSTNDTVTNLYGSKGLASVYQSGTVSNLYGGKFQATVQNNRAVDTGAIFGMNAEVQIDANNQSGSDISTGTVKVVSSVFDDNQASSPDVTVNTTNSYLYYGNYSISNTGGITNKWGLYLSNATKNYLSGTLQVTDDVTIDGGKITLTNGSTIDSESAGTLLLTEDIVKTSGDLLVGGNDIKSSGGTTALTLSGANVTVAGDLTVSGTTTTINTATVEVEDNILQLNTTQASPDTATATTSGISVYRGDGVTQASLIFDDGDDTWDLTNNLVVAGHTKNLSDSSKTYFGADDDLQIYHDGSHGYVDSGTGLLQLDGETGQYHNVAGSNIFRVMSDHIGTWRNLRMWSRTDIRFYDENNNNYVGFQAPADSEISANVVWDLPATDGSANQVLATDGSGNLSFINADSAAGGGDGLTLANGANNRVVTATGSTGLNGEANLTFDGSTLEIVATGAAGGIGVSMQNNEGKFLAYTDGGNFVVKDYQIDTGGSTDGTDLYPFKIMGGSANDSLVVSNGLLTLGGDLKVGGNDIKASDGTTSLTLSGADVTVGGALTAASADIGDIQIRSNNEIENDGSSIFLQYNTGNDVEVGSTGTNADLVVVGRVGISAGERLSSPSSPLHINVDDNDALEWIAELRNTPNPISPTTFGAGIKLALSSGSGDELLKWAGMAAVKSADLNYSRKVDAVFYTQSDASGSAAPTEKMRLTGDGKLGLNMTTPQHTLDIWGDDSSIRLVDTSDTSGSAKIVVGEDSSVTVASEASVEYGWEMHYNSAGDDFFELKMMDATNGDVANALVVNRLGNVGIGNDASNGYKLEVSGTTKLSGNVTLGSSYVDNVSMIGFSGDGGSPNSILSDGQFGISENSDKLTIWEKGTIGGSGATTAAFTFDHNGHFTAVSKSFDIEHPTEEGKRLMHGSLEGPEHGVYIRGRLEGDTIELPDYWLGLVDEDTITVQLTPNKGFQQIYVDHIEDNKVFVGTQTDTPIDCFYFIQAERKDVEKMVVEY